MNGDVLERHTEREGLMNNTSLHVQGKFRFEKRLCTDCWF